jgi:orotate phosphoribosyltransferase
MTNHDDSAPSGTGLDQPRVDGRGLDAAALAAEITARCRLEGEFVLRSGRIANYYFDKYRFEADPRLLATVAQHLVPLVPQGTEVLAGLELGGVPIAVALSAATGLPVCFVRKKGKEYGTARLAEGAEIEGRQLLVVEDVVTTGGQVALSTYDLRKRGARIDKAICVIDRREGGPTQLDQAGVELVALFTADDLGGT